MIARKPDFKLDEGKIIWSQIPEFSMTYNGASIAIPFYEGFLNGIMNEIRTKHCADNPALKYELDVFVQQEGIHANFHRQYNKRMFDAGFDELKPLVEELIADLKQLRRTRSLAFNIGFCAGFETIATFGSKYLYEECDEFFKGADPQGANLVLWHVAEEFEHRAVCHNAFNAVSGNYFTRIYALLVAFRHVGSCFKRAEAILLKHYWQGLSDIDLKKSMRKSKSLYRRQLIYLAPRMLMIIMPGYDPANIKMPDRIRTALDYFASGDPITRRYDLVAGSESATAA